MKTKVTITLERELVPRAKRFAAARGTSLSAVIESALRRLTASEDPRFSAKWRGRFRPADRRGDTRYKELAEKYLK
jgi:hypothetical protein